MKNKIVVGMGEALWDVLPEGKKIGGAPANFAYHVSQFGLKSCVVSAIGDDALGAEILKNFDEKQLCHLIDTVPYPTGTVQVEIDQAGIPQYEIKENVAWDNIPYTAKLESLAENTRAVCFGSLAQRNVVSRSTINRFLDAIPEENDPLIVFDVNLRQGFYNKEILCNSMKRCNILKINDEELVTVSRMFGYPGIDLQDKCWILLGKYNLKMLILTCGINGSYVFTPGNVSFQPTPSEPATRSPPPSSQASLKASPWTKPTAAQSRPRPSSAPSKAPCPCCPRILLNNPSIITAEAVNSPLDSQLLFYVILLLLLLKYVLNCKLKVNIATLSHKKTLTS